MKKTIIAPSLILILLFVITLPASALTNPEPGLFATLGLTDISVQGVIMFVIERILLPLVGLISMLFIIVGGFRYITARGNEEQAESGKKTLANAIIGLVLVILSYIIVVVVINALKGNV